MNILYTSYYAEGHGGAEVSLALAASEIQKLGHNVFVASSDSYEHHGLTTLKFKKYAKIPLFRFHESYLPKFLVKVIKEKNIDIVHANDRLTAVSAVLAAKHCGIPAVIHFRDYWFACPKSTMLRHDLKQCDGCGLAELYNCSTPKRFLWDFYKMLYLKRARKILKTADAAIAASLCMSEQLLKFGFKNVKIIQNPIALTPSKNLADYKKKFGLIGTVITFVGTFDVHKGIIEFLDVARDVVIKNNKNSPNGEFSNCSRALKCGVSNPRDHNKNISILLVGSGALKSKIENKIKNLGIERNVVLAGNVPYSEMADVYSASDIVVVPSLWAEPFGRVAAEAMCAGRPVLVSDIGGLKDIVSKEFRIPVFDKNAWLSKLNAIISDKNAAAQAGKRNKKHSELYAPDKIANQLIKTYNEVIDAKFK